MIASLPTMSKRREGLSRAVGGDVWTYSHFPAAGWIQVSFHGFEMKLTWVYVVWFHSSGVGAPQGQIETLKLVPLKRLTLISYAMCASDPHHLKQVDSHSPTGPTSQPVTPWSPELTREACVQLRLRMKASWTPK